MAKNWSDYFSENFQQGMKNAQAQKELEAQQEYRQSVLDANLAEKGFERAEGESQNTDKVGIVERLGRGFMAFGDGMTGSHTYNSYLEYKAKIASEKARQQQRAMAFEADLYSKGLERIDNVDEIKQLILQARGNYNKATANGEEPDPSNNQGYVKHIGNSVLKIGGNYYRRTKGGVADFQAVKDELDAKYNPDGLGWTPTTTKVGNTYYRKNTASGKLTRGQELIQSLRDSQNTPQATPQLPTQTVIPSKPVAKPTTQDVSKITDPNLIAMRNAVQSAVLKGASTEELIQGINAEGFSPEDFADLLHPEVPTTNPTKKLLENLPIMQTKQNKNRKKLL